MTESQGRSSSGGKPNPREKRVTLKDLAAHLNLSPATISRALSGSPQADALAPETRARVEKAAQELNYRPNYLARSLRGKRSFSIGVLVPEISEGYAAGVMSGVEIYLAHKGYSYLMVSHRSKSRVLEDYMELLQDRGVEGLVVVAAELERTPRIPTVVVSGHRGVEGVTHVVIDHDAAAQLALGHLKDLGHERIAVFRGRAGNVDSEDRWRAIRKNAAELGLTLRPELTLQLHGEAYGETFSSEGGYREGYAYGEQLLARGGEFSALFAFNDISAIGAMRAFQDAGLQVPEDVSVIGFDDIQSSAYHRPSLTTIRQPLREMGERATEILLHHLSGNERDHSGGFVTMEPQLVVRDSTGPF